MVSWGPRVSSRSASNGVGLVPIVARLFLACMSLTAVAATAAEPQWRSIGPGGGYVYDLAHYPNDPSLVFAATSAGVYRTADAGVSWSVVGLGDRPFWSVAIHPRFPLLVLAGECRLWEPSGLYRSLDGGATWHALAMLPGVSCVSDIALDPGNVAIAYLGTNEGVLKTADAGASWSFVLTTWEIGNRETWRVVAALDDAQTLYVPVRRRNSPATVFKSTDGGATWSSSSSGLDPAVFDLNDLAIDPGDSRILYLATDVGLYRSADSGVTWSVLDAGSRQYGTQWYRPPFYVVCVTAGEPHVVHALADSLYSSADGGASWEARSRPGRPWDRPYALLTPPDGEMLLAGTGPDGCFRSEDGGRSWHASNNGFHGSKVTALLANRRGELFAGTEDQEILRSADRGESWQFTTNLLRHGPAGPDDCSTNSNAIVEAPAAPAGLLAVGDCGLVFSADAGSSWKQLAHIPCGRSVLADPTDPDTLLLAADDCGWWGSIAGIHRTSDGGENWINATASLGTPEASSLVWDPWYPGRILAGVGRPWNAADGRWRRGAVLASTDRGVTWIVVAELPFGVTTVLPDPSAPTRLYAGTEDGVYRSTDGGSTWLPTPGSVPCSPPALPCLRIRALTRDPLSPATLYAGTALGVQVSHDYGEHWHSLNEGLTSLDVRALAFSTDGRTLFAGTYGHGAFALDLRSSVVRRRLPRPPRD